MDKLHLSILLNCDNRIRVLGDRLARAGMPSAALECRSLAEQIGSVMRAAQADDRARTRRADLIERIGGRM